MTEWIGAAEAAQRLGIKQASLYAYVSRGVLARRRDAGGRGSLFDADEIARLALKGRPRRAPSGAELIIESSLTQITGSHFRYRGHDAVELATRRSFEQVAELLWTGALEPGTPAAAAGAASDGAFPDDAAGLGGAGGGAAVGGGAGLGGAAGLGGVAGLGGGADPDGVGAGGWWATPPALAAGTAAQAALPAGTLPLERLQVIVPALAATDPLRLQLERPAVIAAGRSMIAGMIGCLPCAGERPALAGDPGSVAGRLAQALCPGRLTAGLVSAVQTALVLVADHELAASTLAARVAASVRADPYAVVATGLGALGGALHGGAALGAEVMLGSAAGPPDAPRVIGDLLRRGERIPGFGHFVYKAGDPRAVLLLRVIAEHAPDSPRLAVSRAVLAEAHRRALPEPNIDFALATLAAVAGMVPGAGEAIFAVARTAGWIAHAMEEYDRNAPIRPRSVYTGPAPLPESAALPGLADHGAG
jgi:citrate synthase